MMRRGNIPLWIYFSGIHLYTTLDVNRLIFIRRLQAVGLTLDEIRMCLGSVPQTSNRRLRVQHTVKLFQMQKEKIDQEKAKLTHLEEDIEVSAEKISLCLKCPSKQCPEQCSSFGLSL
jgi:DNA-binding transcriptional MerR regulator